MTGPVETALESLDLRLFGAIEAQSTPEDRRAWLAVQRSVRRIDPGYVYLEIGSHLGGSIQQHVVDPRCLRVFSIDKRPLEQPDDRTGGATFRYEDNSSARMLRNLTDIEGADVSKIECFDADARDVDPARVDPPPAYCFIDGEHTRAAARSDFEFCLEVCRPDAAICFHDDWIVFPAIRDAHRLLRERRIPFEARKLPGSTYLIGLGDCPALRDPFVLEKGVDGGRFLRRRRIYSAAERYAPWLTRRLLAWRGALQAR